MNIMISSSTQEKIRQNECQMRFLDKLVLKQDLDKKLMINEINCLMLESVSTYYYDDMDNGVSKSIALEPTIKHSMKETSLGCGVEHLSGNDRKKYRSRNIPNGKSYPEINESLLNI